MKNKNTIFISCCVLAVVLIAIIAMVWKKPGGSPEGGTPTATDQKTSETVSNEQVTGPVESIPGSKPEDETISEEEVMFHFHFGEEKEIETRPSYGSSEQEETEETEKPVYEDLKIYFSENLDEEIYWIFFEGFHETFMEILYEYINEKGCKGEIHLSVTEYSLDDLNPVYHFTISGLERPFHLDFDMSVNAFIIVE